ncbi:hypothetical protein [Ensifer sp. BR816]|nr:hypothetical protein [Ensifer sp. BR816]
MQKVVGSLGDFRRKDPDSAVGKNDILQGMLILISSMVTVGELALGWLES